MKLGDRLRWKVDEGLAYCGYDVVTLSRTLLRTSGLNGSRWSHAARGHFGTRRFCRSGDLDKWDLLDVPSACSRLAPQLRGTDAIVAPRCPRMKQGFRSGGEIAGYMFPVSRSALSAVEALDKSMTALRARSSDTDAFASGDAGVLHAASPEQPGANHS